MSKKNLLNESQVRQFMKLAKLGPLTPGFVTSLTEATDEDLEEGHGRGAQEYNKPPHRGGGMAPGNTRLNEDDLEAELHATEDELGAEDHVADEEGDELADLESAPADGPSEDELLAALEVIARAAGLEGIDMDVTGDPDPVEDEVEVADVDAVDMEADTDMEIEDEDVLEEDKPYTSKKEKPGADKRKGAEKRGAEATKLKHDEPGGRGHKKGDDAFVNEDEAYTSKREKPGADKRKGAEKRGAEATKLKHDEPGGRGHKKGDDAYVNEATDELVEQITKRVAARILKSALAKK